MRFSALLLFAIAFVQSPLNSQTSPAPSNPVARVTGGAIEGTFLADHRGAAFRGIPYAAPPVGELRWRDPHPVTPWKGSRSAQKNPPACAQLLSGEWNRRAAENGSEDCLYLSVDTPDLKPAKAMPVMVWIHGGANAAGDMGASEPPIAEPLTMPGVILVRIQYRLGYFGFLAHPELTDESGRAASGNYALLDQIQALAWVRDNIAAFGGDASRVTVFGQSAGAYDVLMLMASPLARGLFHRAILESAPSLNGLLRINTLRQEEQKGLRFAARLSAPERGQLAYLRQRSMAEILKASPEVDTDGEGVITDGYVLPADPLEIFRAHKEAAIPMVIGTNAAEEAFPGDRVHLAEVVRSVYSPEEKPILDFYGLADAPARASAAIYGDINHQFATDIYYRCHNALVSDLHSKIAPTFQYEYAHPIPGREKEGPIHCAELGHVFGTFFMGGPPTEEDRLLSAKIVSYWTSFAKYGDVNGPKAGDAATTQSLTVWPQHDANTRLYIEFADSGPTVRANLRTEPCKMLDTADLAHVAAKK